MQAMAQNDQKITGYQPNLLSCYYFFTEWHGKQKHDLPEVSTLPRILGQSGHRVATLPQ